MADPTYELLKELRKLPHYFTEEMRLEYFKLTEILERGTDGPDFPWDRYDHLHWKHIVISLPEDYRSFAQERQRNLGEIIDKVHRDVMRDLSIPVTNANVDKRLAIAEGLHIKMQQIDKLLKDLDKLLNLEKKLFGPITPQPHTIPCLSPWEPLLIGEMNLDGFFKFLMDCGLLTPTGEVTTLGRGETKVKPERAPLVGPLLSLMEAKLLDKNAKAICEALASQKGRIEVSLNEGSLRTPSHKAKTYSIMANEKLLNLGFLPGKDLQKK